MKTPGILKSVKPPPGFDARTRSGLKQSKDNGVDGVCSVCSRWYFLDKTYVWGRCTASFCDGSVLPLATLKRVVRKSKKPVISQYIWSDIKRKYYFQCAWCKSGGLLTKDHIKPISKGGTDDQHNIQPLCRTCNLKKANSVLGANKDLFVRRVREALF